MTGRSTVGDVIDVGGEHAELFIDPGTPALGTGQLGIRTHQQLEIVPAGGTFVFVNWHDYRFLALQQRDSISRGTYHRRRNPVKTDYDLQRLRRRSREREGL
jgi:hypothetical protein